MHRRARHLTGRPAGADLFFDARRIQGLSDGTAVQTWSDLSTNANDATQGTLANRPLYKVNIQGGNPMLLFDNSNDFLRCSKTATLGSASTQVYLFKLSSASSNIDSVFYYGNFNVYSPNYNWVGLAHENGNYQLGNYNNPTEGSVFYTANTSTRVLSGVLNDSGTNRMFLEGSQVATATYTTITGISSSARPMIGEVENTSTPGTYMDGYIGVIGYWSVLTTTSLRKRFEQAIGFSFKIACS